MNFEKTPKYYCGASTDDAHLAFLAIKKKYPNNPLYAIGMSLGANILVNVFLRYISFVIYYSIVLW